MFDYCHEDFETSFMLAHERFALLAMRGDDIGNRESYTFHIEEGVKAKEVLQTLEEDGFIDYLTEQVELGNINNTRCNPGGCKRVTGRLEFSECGDVLRFNYVKWELV